MCIVQKHLWIHKSCFPPRPACDDGTYARGGATLTDEKSFRRQCLISTNHCVPRDPQHLCEGTCGGQCGAHRSPPRGNGLADTLVDLLVQRHVRTAVQCELWE